MSFNIEDADVSHALEDSYPRLRNVYAGTEGLEREYTRMHSHDAERPPPREGAEEAERREAVEEAIEEEEPAESRPGHGGRSASAASSSVSSVSSIQREEMHSGARQRPSRLDSLALTETSPGLEKAFMEYLDRHPTAVKRVAEHRLQHSLTVGSSKFGDRPPVELPLFGGGKPYPPLLPEQEEYVVEFAGFDDPRHPQNWAMKKKIGITAILIFDALAATFASSIFSSAMTDLEHRFHKGREVVTLGTSLFVLGYAVGPMFFAPMSELYGRRIPVIIAAFGFGIFNIAVAVAKDFQTVMICRFFAGLFGSCPLTLVAAVFADMYNNEIRGTAVACFSATIFVGPLLGPAIGGFVAKSYLGWRWTAYLPAFMGFASCILSFYFQQESYGPVILVSKASELRRLTRNWGIHAKQEEVEVDLKELLSKNISRPLRILFTETIVLLITIYMSFLYGILYLSLTAYGIIFGQIYGFSPGVSGLPFIGMIVGVFIGFLCILILNGNYVKKLKANNNIPVPEWRLPLTMVGGILFACGLFWLGWGGYKKSTPWIVPTLSGLFLGFGIYTVFLQCLNYIIDAYLMFAASAIAANTIMRSCFGAVFPLFAYYMFEGIGINWGMTLLGCLATLFIPMPFIFYFFGRRIRAKSKFAPAPDIAQDKRRDEESRGASENEETKANGNGSSSSEDARKEE